MCLISKDKTCHPTYCLQKRDVSCSSKKIFIISTVVGGILLIFGLLALAGTCSPGGNGALTTLLQKFKYAAEFVGTKLGVDALQLSIFLTSFGGGFFFCGFTGSALRSCQKTPSIEEKI